MCAVKDVMDMLSIPIYEQYDIAQRVNIFFNEYYAKKEKE